MLHKIHILFLNISSMMEFICYFTFPERQSFLRWFSFFLFCACIVIDVCTFRALIFKYLIVFCDYVYLSTLKNDLNHYFRERKALTQNVGLNVIAIPFHFIQFHSIHYTSQHSHLTRERFVHRTGQAVTEPNAQKKR